MRGLRPGLTRTLSALAATAALAGCASSSGDDAAVRAGSGEITNPGGKPRDDQEAQQAQQRRAQGEAINASRNQAASAEAAARAQTGGK